MKTSIVLLAYFFSIRHCHVTTIHGRDEITNQISLERPQNSSSTFFIVKLVDERDSYGHNAIYRAVTRDDTAKASVLVELGADLKQLYGSNTLLHVAAEHGSTRVTSWLVQQGLDVNSLTDFGDTPLHFAAAWGGLHEVKLLLQLKACINCRNKYGFTPLALAFGNSVKAYLKSKNATQ